MEYQILFIIEFLGFQMDMNPDTIEADIAFDEEELPHAEFDHGGHIYVEHIEEGYKWVRTLTARNRW